MIPMKSSPFRNKKHYYERKQKKPIRALLWSFVTKCNYAFAAAFCLNSSLIFSTSTDFITGLKFRFLRDKSLTLDLDLSFLPFRFNLVTAINAFI